MKKHLPLIAIGLVWVLSLAWFGLSIKGCHQSRPGAGPGAGRDTQAWHGIYMGRDKIGYSVTITRGLPGGGRSVANKSMMRLAMMGQPQEILTAMNYDLGPDYALRNFEFRLSGAAQIQVAGRVSGRLLKLVVTSGGQSQNQAISLDGPIYLPDAIEQELSGRKLRPGDRHRFSVFDPASLSLQPATVTVVSLDSIQSRGRKVWAAKLALEFSGVTSYAWIDTLGQTLREEGPMGITLVAEDRDSALALPEAGEDLDLLTALSVPALGLSIASPRSLARMAVVLDGLDASGFDISSGRQQLVNGRVVVEREAIPTSQDQQGTLPDSLKQYLSPTPLIQSQDRNIRSLADSLTRGLAQPWPKAVALSDWVFASVEKRMTVSLPSAVEVLQSRQGDCNEHATLFAALARAAGIPARLCLGVVYLDGRFYYHAWNAVYCGRWVEVDPTFGQCPADAARLRLVLGDLSQQNRLLPALGHLQVEIRETR